MPSHPAMNDNLQSDHGANQFGNVYRDQLRRVVTATGAIGALPTTLSIASKNALGAAVLPMGPGDAAMVVGYGTDAENETANYRISRLYPILPADDVPRNAANEVQGYLAVTAAVGVMTLGSTQAAVALPAIGLTTSHFMVDIITQTIVAPTISALRSVEAITATNLSASLWVEGLGCAALLFQAGTNSSTTQIVLAAARLGSPRAGGARGSGR